MRPYAPYAMMGFLASLVWACWPDAKFVGVVNALGFVFWTYLAWQEHEIRVIQKQIRELEQSDQ